MQISISNYLSHKQRSWSPTPEIATRYRVSWKLRSFYFFGGFWLVVLDPQKSNRAKNCCTCLQYGKAPSNIDLVPTPEIATIFLKPRDSPRFVLQIVAAITPCVKTSFLLKWLFQNFKYEMELRWTLLPADIFRGQNIEVDKCDRFCPRNFVVWSLDMSRDFPWQLDYTPYFETIYKTIALFLLFFFLTHFFAPLAKFLLSRAAFTMVSVGVYLRTDSGREILIVRIFDMSRDPKETKEIKRVSLTADFPCCKTSYVVHTRVIWNHVLCHISLIRGITVTR